MANDRPIIKLVAEINPKAELKKIGNTFVSAMAVGATYAILFDQLGIELDVEEFDEFMLAVNLYDYEEAAKILTRKIKN